MQTIHPLGVYVFIFPSLLKCVTTAQSVGEWGLVLGQEGKARARSDLLLEGAGPAGIPPNKDLPHRVYVTA